MGYKYNPFTGRLTPGTSLTNPVQFKGTIAVAADFPTSAEVQTGWMYFITANVTDNDPTKTNTGLSFVDGDEVAWDGSTWEVLGNNTSLWSRVGTDLVPLNAGDDVLISGKLDTGDRALYSGINIMLDWGTGRLQTPTGTQLDWGTSFGTIYIGNNEPGVDFRLRFEGESSQGNITWDEDLSRFKFSGLAPEILVDIDCGSIIIGDGDAGRDYSITFVGQDSTGILTWMEDESRFDIDNPLHIDTSTAGALIIGNGTAGVDYNITFDGETNDGVITWLEDEDQFTMNCSLAVNNLGSYKAVLGDDTNTRCAYFTEPGLNETFILDPPYGIFSDISGGGAFTTAGRFVHGNYQFNLATTASGNLTSAYIVDGTNNITLGDPTNLRAMRVVSGLANDAAHFLNGSYQAILGNKTGGAKNAAAYFTDGSETLHIMTANYGLEADTTGVGKTTIRAANGVYIAHLGDNTFGPCGGYFADGTNQIYVGNGIEALYATDGTITASLVTSDPFALKADNAPSYFGDGSGNVTNIGDAGAGSALYTTDGTGDEVDFFGNSSGVYTSVGNGASTRAGYFVNGTRTVSLSDSSNNVTARFSDSSYTVDINTSNEGIKVTAGGYNASIGDSFNTRAGYFTDGTNVTSISDGTQSLHMTNAGGTATAGHNNYSFRGSGWFSTTVELNSINQSAAGYFSDGTSNVKLGENSITFRGVEVNQGGNLAVLGDSTAGRMGYFYDGNFTVTLADNFQALTATDGSFTAYLADGFNTRAADFFTSTGYRATFAYDPGLGGYAAYFDDGTYYTAICDGSWAIYTNGPVGIDGPGTATRYLRIGDGSTSPVSTAGESNLRYNNSTKEIEASVDGGSYAALFRTSEFFQPISSTDAAAPNNSVYYSTTQAKLVYKDAGGGVNVLY